MVIIKEIGDSFAANGYKYSLIERIRDIALWHGKNKYGSESWEVHKIRINSYPCMAGLQYTHYERLPKNEDFGKFGWCYFTYSKAKDKFNKLVGGE